MKLSLTVAATDNPNYPAILKGDIVKNIKQAASWGFDAVEIHVADPGTLNWAEIAKTSEESGVEVSSIGTGLAYAKDQLSFADSQQHRRHHAVERICLHIEAAKHFKAVVIIGSIRGSAANRESFKKYEAYVIDCLKKCLDKAEKENVDLVMEAINRYETNLINKVDQGIALINEIGSERLKLHLDTFHMNIEEANFVGSINKADALLKHVHFADSNRCYPGSGHINFAEIINALKNINYRGTIAFEYLPLPTPEEAALKGISRIKSLM